MPGGAAADTAAAAPPFDPSAVVRPIVVAAPVVARDVVVPLPLMLSDPVMLTANVVGGVIAAMTRLGDGWSGDRNSGGEREK